MVQVYLKKLIVIQPSKKFFAFAEPIIQHCVQKSLPFDNILS